MTQIKCLLMVLGALAVAGLLGDPAWATPRPANVPAPMEIAVLDPNVERMGRPAILTTPGIPGSGTLQIDVPPTVLVHRYYYTGDRRFQAQLLPGGPCVVVVNHPKTAERCYIPVQMIPGAPRVTYTSNTIEYDYGHQGITIRFCCLLSAQPKVEYRNSMTVARHVENCSTKVNAACKEFADRSGLTNAQQQISTATKNACKDTADRIGAVGRGLCWPVAQISQFIPGAQMLKTTDEDRAMRLRDAQVQGAEKAAAGQNLTIPTGR